MIKLTENSSGMRKLDDVLSGFLERCGNQIVEDAKELCPVKTGALKESLELDVNDLGKTEDKTVVIYSNKPYAAYVEYHQAYLRPALDGLETKIRDLI